MLSSDNFQKPFTATSKHAPSQTLAKTRDAYAYKAVIGAVVIGL